MYLADSGPHSNRVDGWVAGWLICWLTSFLAWLTGGLLAVLQAGLLFFASLQADWLAGCA